MTVNTEASLAAFNDQGPAIAEHFGRLGIMRELCFGTRGLISARGRAAHIAHGAGAASQGACRCRRGANRGEAEGQGPSLSVDEGRRGFPADRRVVERVGQRWGQGMVAPDDLDPRMLVWGMRRQIDPAPIPAQSFVIRLDFRGLPKSNRSPRNWWLVMRPDDIEVCLKAPARDVDAVVSADLATSTKVWLGYAGVALERKDRPERGSTEHLGRAPPARAARPANAQKISLLSLSKPRRRGRLMTARGRNVRFWPLADYRLTCEQRKLVERLANWRRQRIWEIFKLTHLKRVLLSILLTLS
jgi:hypothetical protein